MSIDLRSNVPAWVPTQAERDARCCGRKARHGTRRLAYEALIGMDRMGIERCEDLHVYLCGACGGWHIGNWRKGATR